MTDDPERLWSDYVTNGKAFAGTVLQTVVAGQIAHVQIFNPVGSGVRVRLRCLETIPIFSAGINTNPRRHDIALPVLGAFLGPDNLLGSGSAPVAELRTLTQVGAVGSPFWLILSAGVTRKDYPALNMDWGHDLLEGQGIVLQSAVGGFIYTGFMWAEVTL